MFKKFKWWLAGKIIGGQIIEEVDMQARKHDWVKEQLSHGNSVTLEYKVTNIDEKRKRA